MHFMRDTLPFDTVRSLKKSAIDNLVDQLFSQMGNHPRIVGPEGAFSPLDDKYVGVLKQLLQQFIPNIPDSVLQTVKEDLIVVTQTSEPPSQMVAFGRSTLRVATPYSNRIESIKRKYSDLINSDIIPTTYLESDLMNPSLIFQDTFFTERSIKGWCRVILYFARICATMEQAVKEAGLKHGHTIHSDRETDKLYTAFVDSSGYDMELITPA